MLCYEPVLCKQLWPLTLPQHWRWSVNGFLVWREKNCISLSRSPWYWHGMWSLLHLCTTLLFVTVALGKTRKKPSFWVIPVEGKRLCRPPCYVKFNMQWNKLFAEQEVRQKPVFWCSSQCLCSAFWSRSRSLVTLTSCISLRASKQGCICRCSCSEHFSPWILFWWTELKIRVWVECLA